MLSRLLVLSASLSCFLLAACAQGELKGQILHFETHQAIKGARITLSKMPPPYQSKLSVLTDTSGSYRFTGLEKASYALEVEAPGFKPTNDLISLTDSTFLKRDVLLFPDLPKYLGDEKSMLKIPSQFEVKSTGSP